MKLVFVLLAVVAMAFASSTISGDLRGSASFTLPATDDELDSYAFDAGTAFAASIPASFTDYAVVDDFTASGGENTITSLTCWGLTTGAAPTALEVLVVADASGPDGAPISADSYPCATSASGYTFAGYDILTTVIDLSGNPIVVADGVTVWLGSHRNDGVTWYPDLGTIVTGMNAYRTQAAGWAWEDIATSIEAGDLFKVIEGDYTSLDRNTWAGIKNMF